MLADFYIARISNVRKIAAQKNHLGGLIFYRSLDSSKKQRLNIFEILKHFEKFYSNFGKLQIFLDRTIRPAP